LKIAVFAAPQFGELTYEPYPGYRKKAPQTCAVIITSIAKCATTAQSKIKNRKSKIEMSWEARVNWVEPDKRAIDLEQVSQK